MEAGIITTVLLVACATICIGVGIFYFFINNTKNKGRICILLLGIGGGIWALGSALYGNCTDDRLAQNFFCMTIVGFNLYVIAIVIYVACLTGVKIKGYGLMVGLGILTSLVDGVSFGSMRIRHFYRVNGRTCFTTEFHGSVFYHWMYIMLCFLCCIYIVLYWSKKIMRKSQRKYVAYIILGNTIMLLSSIPDTVLPFYGIKSYPSSVYGVTVSFLMTVFFSIRYDTFGISKLTVSDYLFNQIDYGVMVYDYQSGSAPATVVAIGTMLYGDMVRMGYPGDRTAGLLVVSGGLGPIIPPSIIMVVYATITGASVGDMFKSGMGIGIGIMIVLMIVVIVLAHKEQWPKDEIHFNLKEFCISFLKAIPALMLPIIILGGIYSGLLTATESSAIAVVWSFIAGMFIYRELKWSDLFDIFVDSAKSSAMTLFIIATSTAFAWLFAYAGISQKLVDFVVGMNLSATMYCLVVAVILLIFGTFLEGIATAVLLVPVLWPVAQALGVNVIHFGMIVSIANVVGTMTPPVAVNIFSAASVTKLSMGKIVHGQWPFFIGYVGFFFLVVFIPALSTFLL